MKIRIMSDLHMEFERLNRDGTPKYPDTYFTVPELPDDKDTVLLLAGDIGVVKRPRTIATFIKTLEGRFKAVLCILGNHEYYDGSLNRAYDKLFALLDGTGVTLLENDKVEIDDVVFLGTTLWTDYNNHNPLSVMHIENTLTDFATIRTGLKKEPYKRTVRAVDFHSKFLNAKTWLNSELYNAKIRDGKKCVVMTHHAPSFQSVHHRYILDHDLNGAYASNLESMIREFQPEVWVHGHTHDSMRYDVYDTRVICNPRGYTPSDLNKDFDPCLVIGV